jgi:hypothetical protein
MLSDAHEESLANIQRRMWREYQREQMKMSFVEVPFSVLTEHPRWVPPSLRKDFDIGQTRPEDRAT